MLLYRLLHAEHDELARTAGPTHATHVRKACLQDEKLHSKHRTALK